MEVKKYLSDEMLRDWKRLVDNAQRIVVLGHAGPDGDAVGSILAMVHYLRSLGKVATPMAPNPCPDFLQWMPGASGIIYHKTNRSKAEQFLSEADLIMCLDFGVMSRLEDLCGLVEGSDKPIIVVDHHLDPTIEADLMVSDPLASATCEILFCLFYQIGAYQGMGRDMAACLYTGLMTDTGAFAFNSNRPEVFLIVSLLIAKRIDKDQIYRNVFYSYTEKRLRLMGYLMNEKLMYFPAQHAALFCLTKQEMERFDFVRGDAEGFVNLPLQIKGTKLSISLRQDTEKPLIRVSLRSVGDFQCNKMAEEFFNGGGHKNASGGSLQMTMDEAVERAKMAIMACSEQLR